MCDVVGGLRSAGFSPCAPELFSKGQPLPQGPLPQTGLLFGFSLLLRLGAGEWEGIRAWLLMSLERYGGASGL